MNPQTAAPRADVSATFDTAAAAEFYPDLIWLHGWRWRWTTVLGVRQLSGIQTTVDGTRGLFVAAGDNAVAVYLDAHGHDIGRHPGSITTLVGQLMH